MYAKSDKEGAGEWKHDFYSERLRKKEQDEIEKEKKGKLNAVAVSSHNVKNVFGMRDENERLFKPSRQLKTVKKFNKLIDSFQKKFGVEPTKPLDKTA